jgi:hypothetical protein
MVSNQLAPDVKNMIGITGDPTAFCAYSVAGRIVLNQSDLLIAVWDGGKPAGGGGTVETLREAVHYHVPALWIDAQARHRPSAL